MEDGKMMARLKNEFWQNGRLFYRGQSAVSLNLPLIDTTATGREVLHEIEKTKTGRCTNVKTRQFIVKFNDF